jgi:hypothetical protein
MYSGPDRDYFVCARPYKKYLPYNGMASLQFHILIGQVYCIHSGESVGWVVDTDSMSNFPSISAKYGLKTARIKRQPESYQTNGKTGVKCGIQSK